MPSTKSYLSDRSGKPIESGKEVGLTVRHGDTTKYLYLTEDEFETFVSNYHWEDADEAATPNQTQEQPAESTSDSGTTKPPRKKTPYQRLEQPERDRVKDWLEKQNRRKAKSTGAVSAKDTKEACAALSITIPEDETTEASEEAVVAS